MSKLMKGHTFKKHSHKMVYPCVVEAKVDEIRVQVLVRNGEVEFLSFAGKPLWNLGEFSEAFAKLSENSGITEFDCGVVVRGTFADTYRYVRSKTGIPDDLRGAAVQFMLFDIPENRGTYTVRRVVMERLTFDARYISLPLYLPRFLYAHDHEAVLTAYELFRKAGYEGAMAKSYEHTYEPGTRSYGWLKVKPEDDADGVITGIHEAVSENGHPLGRAGSVTITCPDGSTATPHGLPHDLGRDIFEHPEKYLGECAEFKYMERDRQGGYRHPVFHRIREENV